MKIRKIKIKGYKVFDDIEFDFTDSEGKALDTIVIAGVNGSGKTTLLELISYLFNNIYSASNQPIDINPKVKNLFNIGEICIESNVNQTLLKEINKYIDEDSKNEYLKEYKRKVFRNEQNTFNLYHKSHLITDRSFIIDKDNFYHFLHFISLTHSTNYQPRIYYIPANTYLHEPIYDNREELKNIFSRISKTGHGIVSNIDFKEHKKYVEKVIVETALKEVMNNQDSTPKETIQKMVAEINQIIDAVNIKTRLVDITSEEPIFESFNGERISINDLSNGEKQIFYRAVFLQNMNINDSIILVDEPETSLHPTWQQAIVKLYQNIGKNNQVILASHSPHVISSVKPENLFVLYPNSETSKIEVMNMGKEHKNTKGLEPNRVLKEIMGTPLRDYETQQKIKKVTENLNVENFENPEIQDLIEELSRDLGRQDSFIMKVNHQIMMLKRKKVPAN